MTLHATGASTRVVSARALSAANAGSNPSLLGVLTPDRLAPADEPAQGTSTTVADIFDIAGFELVREFVDHLIAERTARSGRDASSARRALDWDALTTSVADATSLEVAIGRAVASADRLVRESSSERKAVDADPTSTTEAQFFAFTQDDAVPDFGDDRYRSRFARRFANVIGRDASHARHRRVSQRMTNAAERGNQ
jgi:hypothetical protein